MAGQPQSSGGLQCAACASVISNGSPCCIWVSFVHHSNQPPRPPVCCGVMLQGRWGPGGSWRVLGMGCGGLAAVRDQDHPWCPACVNTSFGCPCPCRWSPRSESPLCPVSELFPASHSSLCSSVELQGEIGGAGTFAWLRLGCIPGWSQENRSSPQSALSTLPWEQASTHILLPSGAQSGFPQPSS